jgi:HD-like signal output (HDOD) protein
MSSAEPQLRTETSPVKQTQENSGNYEFIRELLTTLIHSRQIDVPVLPQVAARVVTLAAAVDVDSQRLSKLITADPALALHVMRVAASAAYMPNSPLTSLNQAITWLGLGEVANIAFTVAVQGKLLNVPGQRSEVLAMWREAVCTGVWARELAGVSNGDAGALYLCGLLHEIGKPVVLQAVTDVCQRTRTFLTTRERMQLMNEFKRVVGTRVVRDWKLPEAVAITLGYWNDPTVAPTHKREAILVGLAHRMAECSLNNDSDLERNAVAGDERAGELGIGPDGMRALLNRTERVLAQVRTY